MQPDAPKEPETKVIETPTPTAPAPKRKFAVKLPGVWKLLTILLVIALALSIWFWKPWQPRVKASERTISVVGNTTIKAEPDEFEFYPSYEFTSSNKQDALNKMTAKSNEIVSKLKDLGVASSKIKTDSQNYGDLYYDSNAGSTTYYLSLTVTIDNKDLAQKVQDYLLTTNPQGSVTPSATFSTEKQKQLEDQARDKAEQNARAKADQSAKNLGFKVHTVKSVEDGTLDSGYGGCRNGLCMGANINASLDSGSNSNQLTLQPGENELSYSIKVTYYIK